MAESIESLRHMEELRRMEERLEAVEAHAQSEAAAARKNARDIRARLVKSVKREEVTDRKKDLIVAATDADVWAARFDHFRVYTLLLKSEIRKQIIEQNAIISSNNEDKKKADDYSCNELITFVCSRATDDEESAQQWQKQVGRLPWMEERFGPPITRLHHNALRQQVAKCCPAEYQHFLFDDASPRDHFFAVNYDRGYMSPYRGCIVRWTPSNHKFFMNEKFRACIFRLLLLHQRISASQTMPALPGELVLMIAEILSVAAPRKGVNF